MAVLLAALAASFSGAGDFFGGLASRLGRPLAVGVTNHVVGVAAAAILALFIAGNPVGADMAWGATAGISGALAILFLYRGFAVGEIAVVSPIAAVGAAGWPVIYSLARGDRPSLTQAAGLTLGIAAIWTISRSPSLDGARATSQGVTYGMLAGLGFGGLLIFLSFVTADSGVWPLVPARFAGGVILVLVGISRSDAIWPGRRSFWPAAAAGALTVIGNSSFILAANRGSLAVVSVIAAMFPAATVLLARVVLAERLGRRRVAGLALALLAVALVAAG